MTSYADTHNGGAYVRTHRGGADIAVVAGGSGDAVQVNSAWASRKAANGLLGIASSMKVMVSYSAVLAAAATLKFAGNIQDAADINGTGAAQYPATSDGLFPSSIAATGPAGGGTVTGTFELDVDLAGAREFVRAQITPDLSAGATDTVSFHIDYIFMGQQRGPTTKSPVNLGSADAI